MNKPWIWQLLSVAVVAHFCVGSACATQHLINPGQDWQRLAADLKPGDQIILMPGHHRPATLDRLTGSRRSPIIIRGLDPKRPSIIDASRYGLVLHQPQHVMIENLTITGATISGLVIDDLDTTTVRHPNEPEPATAGEPWSANLLLRDLSVTNTGPEGKRHAVLLSGLRDVRIYNVHIEGWGGSAFEVIGCHGVSLESCRFIAKDDHTQLNGIRVRAGSQRVNIIKSHFEGIAEAVVVLGGMSKLPEFRPSLAPDAASGTRYEARFVQIQRCTFVGGAYPIVLAHCDDSLMRNNTFIRPRHAILYTTTAHTDRRIGSTRRAIFGGNLVVWEPGDLRQLVVVAAADDAESFVFQESLWWSTETLQQRARLGDLPGLGQVPQITDVDPKLDEQLRPTEPKAAHFGAKSP